MSRLKADQSGLWHRAADRSELERTAQAQPLRYDGARIAEVIAENTAHDAAWQAWFADQGIVPLSLSYEVLAADPQTSLAKVLSHIGQNPDAARAVQPDVAPLRDALSDAWVARFRAEQALPRA